MNPEQFQQVIKLLESINGTLCILLMIASFGLGVLFIDVIKPKK
jgi:hypothetical protein